MKKKILVSLLFAVLICLLIPSVAFAVTLGDGAIYNISTLSGFNILDIQEGANVTLMGTADCLWVRCQEGVTLTLDNATIKMRSDLVSPAIQFTGKNNTLILVGESEAVGGYREAGIKVQDTTELTIKGTGAIFASGDILYHAQDIGRCYGGSGGTLYISGDASVFLKHYSYSSLSPNTTTHVYRSFNNESELPSGYSIPATWGYPVGGYVKNDPPYFTGDATNTSQKLLTGDEITALKAEDPNYMTDIISYTVIEGSLPDGVTLNNDGTFTGIPQAGDYTMTIEVKDIGDLTDTTTLTLIVRDILVDASPMKTILGYSETYTLAATTEPAGQAITWLSSDPFVAMVDPITGEVTTGMKEGRAVISATCRDSSDECIVYVVDKSEPAPAPSDPLNTISVQIKDDSGNPKSGVYVSLFSEPQTVITDSKGMAVFYNVPYNTIDPHTLIVQDFRGSEIARYSLNFTSGTTAGTSTSEGNIDVTFDNKVNNTNIMLTMVEDRIDKIMVSLGYKPEKVENPQTGDFESSLISIEELMIMFSAILLTLMIYRRTQNRVELEF